MRDVFELIALEREAFTDGPTRDWVRQGVKRRVRKSESDCLEYRAAREAAERIEKEESE